MFVSVYIDRALHWFLIPSSSLFHPVLSSCAMSEHNYVSCSSRTQLFSTHSCRYRVSKEANLDNRPSVVICLRLSWSEAVAWRSPSRTLTAHSWLWHHVCLKCYLRLLSCFFSKDINILYLLEAFWESSWVTISSFSSSLFCSHSSSFHLPSVFSH